MSCFCSCQRKSVSFFPPFHSLFCQFSGSYNRVKLKFLWGLICKKHIYFPHHPNSKRQSRKPKKKKQINRIKWRLFARFPSWGECCVIENAPGRVPGWKRDNRALPALVDDSSFFLLWGTTFLVPGGGCASIQMRQQARVQPGHGEYVEFLLPAASEVGMVLRCLCYGSEQCLFEVWSLGRKPKRTWAGLVWISKSKLKIYSSVWKIPDPNLHMDLKKYRLPCFCSVSNWELEDLFWKRKIKARSNSSINGLWSDSFLAKPVRKVIRLTMLGSWEVLF